MRWPTIPVAPRTPARHFLVLNGALIPLPSLKPFLRPHLARKQAKDFPEKFFPWVSSERSRRIPNEAWLTAPCVSYPTCLKMRYLAGTVSYPNPVIHGPAIPSRSMYLAKPKRCYRQRVVTGLLPYLEMCIRFVPHLEDHRQRRPFPPKRNAAGLTHSKLGLSEEDRWFAARLAIAGVRKWQKYKELVGKSWGLSLNTVQRQGAPGTPITLYIAKS